MRNDAILQNEPEAEDRAEDQRFSISDNAILGALEMMRFASIRQIAQMTFLLPTTRFRRLTKSLHFVLKRLHWVPHRLSDLEKQTPVIMSNESLKLLEYMRHHSGKYVVPLDEACFCLSILRLMANQFETVQKMKLHKGRVISEDHADGRLKRTRVSLD
jgi:hypothetical protein